MILCFGNLKTVWVTKIKTESGDSGQASTVPDYISLCTHIFTVFVRKAVVLGSKFFN